MSVLRANSPRIFLRLQGGLTLVELVITLAIAGILAAIGIPALADFVKDQRAKTAAYDLYYTFNLARSEAIKRNTNVVVTQANGGWQNGWTVTTTFNGTPMTLSTQSPYTKLTIASSVNSVTYQGSGRPSGAVIPVFQVTGATKTRCVAVSLSGVPRSC